MSTSTMVPTLPQALNGVTREPISAHETIHAQLWHLTPEVAKELLKHALPNRPVSKVRVRSMIDGMRGGRWRTNGEGLILDGDLRLLDGRHRCMAVSESGVTIDTLVAIGVSPDVMDSIDQGKARNLADTLSIGGVSHVKELAAVCRWLWRYEHGSMLVIPTGLRNTTIDAFLEQHPGLQTTLEWGHLLKGLLPQSLASALYAVMHGKDGPLAKQVYQRLGRGEDMNTTDPLFTLRERWLRDKTKLTHRATVSRGASLVIIWNALRQGQAKPKSLSWNGATDPDVAFPQVL